MRKMLRKCLNLGLVALFLASLMSVATPVLAHTEGDPYIATLWAGKHTLIGTVSVWNNGTHLFVKYKTEGWVMTETHLYVGTTPPAKGSPGRFPYKRDYDPPVTEDTYVIPLGAWESCTRIYIAAHAVARDGKEETAWAWGPCHSWDLPGRKWGWYFYYMVQDS